MTIGFFHPVTRRGMLAQMIASLREGEEEEEEEGEKEEEEEEKEEEEEEEKDE